MWYLRSSPLRVVPSVKKWNLAPWPITPRRGPSSVAMNDPLNGRKPNSRAFELFGAMQTLEDAEQLMRILHIEPRPIVPDIDFDLVLAPVDAANLDLGVCAIACEFHSIGNKICDDELQHGAVAVTNRQGTGLPYDLPPFVSDAISLTTSRTSSSKLTLVFRASARPILENASRSSMRLPILSTHREWFACIGGPCHQSAEETCFCRSSEYAAMWRSGARRSWKRNRRTFQFLIARIELRGPLRELLIKLANFALPTLALGDVIICLHNDGLPGVVARQ